MNTSMRALRVLDFDAIRQRLSGHCETPLGEVAAAELMPVFTASEAWTLVDETAEAYEAVSRMQLPSLGTVRDYRQALKRAGKQGVLGGQELFGIGEALGAMRQMRTVLLRSKEQLPLLSTIADQLPDLERLEESLLGSLEPDGAVRDSASAALASLRQRKKTASAKVLDRIQSYATGKTRDLLSDPIYTVRDSRYVIPLKAENRGKIRGIVHDTSGSGQTLFLEPDDVVQLGNALREVESLEAQEEHRILEALSGKVGAVAGAVVAGIQAASELDLVLAKARLAFSMKATRPERLCRSDGSIPPRIEIHGGKHPLLPPDSVVPLDLELGEGQNVLITGPNTGGKTVAIKAVGTFVAMMQSGLFVPALHVKFGCFSQIWADIGDEQSLQQSLSTFGGHIKNISEALRFLKPGALVLLDEAGAGTDPAEGAALARSVFNAFTEGGATVFASTHYGELKAFAYNTPTFVNAAMEFDYKTLRPTYRLIMGSPGASHALRIAERYGIPKEVTESARESLGHQALEVTLMMERLDTAQKQARQAQGEADRRSEELKKAEALAKKKLAEAEDVRQKAHERAQEIIDSALREIRLEATRIFEELKKAPTDMKVLEKGRKDLKDLQEVGTAFAREFVPKKPADSSAPGALVKGASVKIDGFSQVGILLEDPKGGDAVVRVGPLKMTVPVHRLKVASRAAMEPTKTKANIQLSKTLTATTELHLRHMRAEEAVRDLEKFIDDALLAGMPFVRIVHGKGGGVLRKITQDYLKKHPGVATYRDGEPAEGGQGVTIVSFR